MLKKILGAIDLLFGLTILGRVGYNYLVEMQPAAKGFNPIIALLFAISAIYFGIKWFSGKYAAQTLSNPFTGLTLTPYRVLGYASWLSRDPLPNAELLQGPNLYRYAANNPVNFVDPDGRCFTPETLWDLLNLLYDAWTGRWDDCGSHSRLQAESGRTPAQSTVTISQSSKHEMACRRCFLTP